MCWVGWFGVVMVWIQSAARRSSSGRLRGAAFDLADAAGVDAEGVADLLLGDAVRDA